jgi:uncharacterized membrane protein YdbT with pleckstrin-like domain
VSTRGHTPPEWLTLAADERVQFALSPSSNLVLASLGVGITLLVAMSVGVGFVDSLATGRVVSFVTLVIIVMLLVGAYGLTEARQYVLTTDRAVVASGLRARRTTSVELAAVDDVQVVQTSWQQLLNVGTVRIRTTRGITVELKLVENPDEIGRYVRQSTSADDVTSGTA